MNTNTAITFTPGVVIAERFEIVKLLGKGGYGEVYQARQLSMQRMVALKVLRARLARNARTVKRFENEARFACRLTDPHTVVYHDFGFDESRGVLFLAMEFLKGETLQKRIKRDGPLTLEQTTALLEQICQSLEEAHELGLVHRDIKPDNLMLIRRAGRLNFVKVIDFGIAKATARFEEGPSGPLTMTGAVLGTPHYMAPEQIQGGVALDPRTDVYALACLSYRMLTGLPPFRGKSAIEIATQHLRVQPPPLSSLTRTDLPSALSDYLLEALSKDMGRRPTSAWAFYDGWCEALGEDTHTAPRVMDFDPVEDSQARTTPDVGAQKSKAPRATLSLEEGPDQMGLAPAEPTPLSVSTAVSATRPRFNARQRRHLSMGLLMLLAGVIFMGAMATLIGKKLLRQQETPPLAMTLAPDAGAQGGDRASSEDSDKAQDPSSANRDQADAAAAAKTEDAGAPLAPQEGQAEAPTDPDAGQTVNGDEPDVAQADERTAVRATSPRRRTGAGHKRQTTANARGKTTRRGDGDSKSAATPTADAQAAAPATQAPPAGALQNVRLVVKPWGSVSINGQTRSSPATFKLKPGRYQATFSARGQTPVKRMVTVRDKAVVVTHDFNL